MRICFATTGDVRITATMKRALGMAPALAARGHQVGILAWDTPANRARLMDECPQAEPLWVDAALPVVREAAAKRRHLRAWRPDIVYVCAYSLRNLILRGAAAGGGRVVIEHSELFSAIRDVRRRYLLELLLEHASVLNADGLLCASRYLVEVYTRRARLLGRKGLPIAYHPYAYTPVAPDPDRLDEIRRAAAGRRIVLYMGTLVRNYGIFDILEATARLARTRTDFTVQVLGHGRHAAEARQVAERLGLQDRVMFHGYAPESDLPAWFAAADVFLAPINDTVQDLARCPSKVYMYLASRKPIVTSPIGDPHDLLGADGFYYPPGDVAGMAATVSRALDASPTWKPQVVDAARHTWAHRTDEFLAWCAGDPHVY